MLGDDACEGVVAALRRQHDRIGELLCELRGDRGRPGTPTGGGDAACIPVQAHLIEVHVGDIARIVALMKG